MAVSLDVAAAAVPEPPPPSVAITPVREQRKRTRKILDPDFVSDYLIPISRGSSSTAYSLTSSDAPAVKKPVRTNPRSKKAKVHSEPSIPVEKSLTERNELTKDYCSECIGTSPYGASRVPSLDQPDDMRIVKCVGEKCPYQAHYGCMYCPPLDETTFRCLDCQHNQCVVCGKGNLRRDANLIQCGKCKDVFHMECHVPAVNRIHGQQQNDSEWLCSTCNPAPRATAVARTKQRSRKKQPKQIKPGTIMSSNRPRKPNGQFNNYIVNWEMDDHSHGNMDISEHSYAMPVVTPVLPPALLGPLIYKPHMELFRPFYGVNQSDDIDKNRHTPPADAGAGNGSLVPMILPGQPCDPEFLPESMLVYASGDERLQERMEKDTELRQDMASWSVEQCASYFQDSDPELAQLILDHDLLGSALIIISRSQFLDLFQLPVGKALRMHAAICRCRRVYF